MGRVSFENYARRAQSGVGLLDLAGRFSFQAIEQRRIVVDVARKLDLHDSDTLLEIGCGAGNLLIPLSRRVKHSTGIDHPAILARLEARDRSRLIRAIPGNFLDLDIHRHFSKILIYSVVHYLSNESELLTFLTKAVGLVKSGGAMLVGDIPNVERKLRFESTDFGRKVLVEYSKKRKAAGEPTYALPEDRALVTINDKVVMDILTEMRRRGFDAWLLPQPEGLPFCYTREDILVTKH